MSDDDLNAGVSGHDLPLSPDHAGHVLLMLGPDGRIRFINMKGCDLLGHHRDRLIGREWFEGCVPDPEDARRRFRRLLEGGGDAGTAEPVLTRSGSLRQVVWRSRVLRDAGGSVICVVRSGTEVPEQRPSGPGGTSGARQDFSATARLIIASCRGLLGAQRGFLAVFDGIGRDAGELILDPAPGGEDVRAALSLLAGRLRAGWPPEEGTVVENDLPGSRWAQASLSPAPRNLLVVPLTFEGRPIGLLGFADKPGGFVDGDASLAAAFADVAALAFNNAEIYRQLVESERRYHTLAEISPVGILRADRSGGCVYVNPQWSAITGIQFEEARGRGWERALHPEDRERVLSRWRDVLGGAREFQEEYRVLRPDGAVVWVLGSGTCETGPDGEPTGYVRTVIDITDRKRIELQQEEHLRFLQQLVDAIPNPIFFKDVGGVYIGCNQAFEEFIGLPRDRIIGRSAGEIAPRDLAAVYEEKDRALFANPGVQVYESGVRYADGSIREVIFTKAPYRDAAGRVSGLIGTIMDITDRKRSETALKTANKKLNLLAGLTRHDVLNQLTVLLGSLDLLLDDVRDPGTVRMLSRSRDAARAIEHLILFTRDYQDVGMASPGWFDVRDTVRAASFSLPASSKILSVDLGDLEIYADPLLQKVFYNLIENALRHGGAVTRIGVSAEPAGKDLVLVFEDDGVGVPEGKKEQIFRREHYANTGFGLFLSREILSITGIAIRESGTPGKGARFELLVPEGAFRYR